MASPTSFPMIVSRPPPYWWHPELPEGARYAGQERAPDRKKYGLLYSSASGIAYLLRFDG
jgi:hypothetical protein